MKCPPNGSNVEVAVDGIRRLEQISAQDDRFLIVRLPEDAVRARTDGKLGLELNLQGVGLLGGELSRIEMFSALGIRHIGLSWNAPNDAGGSATVDVDNGLTAFGWEAIAEMERHGIIVDGAHAGYGMIMETAVAARLPFIVSHPNCFSVTPARRNVCDDQIRAYAQTGGVVGITGFGNDIGDASSGR